MSNRIDVTKNNFFAWSLYTAYRDPKTIGDWVAAKWPGKKIENKQHLKEDLDFRIDMYIKAFKLAIDGASKCNDWVRYFVVPEFYFHSAHGPYPGLQIDGKSTFEYIMENLSHRIKDTLLNSSEFNRDWVICTGGILTTHITDIPAFLETKEVKIRLKRLNELYKKANDGEKHKRTSHIGLMRLKSHKISTSKDKYDEFNDLVNLYRKDPLCTVRNRAGIFVYDSEKQEISKYSIEKQAESTVDLTLGTLKDGKLDTDEQITEWIANYPPVSILSGDNQGNGKGLNRKPGARMPIVSYGQDVELGAEICLDHRLQRLRRTINMTGNKPLDIQLVPSGGMQLLDYSIAGGSKGAIFNADGCDPILDKYTSEGKSIFMNKEHKACGGMAKEITTGVYCYSVQTLSKDLKGKPYFSHSQLSFRTNEFGPDDYVNPKGIENIGGITFTGNLTSPVNQFLDLYDIPKIYKIDSSDKKIHEYFTAGLGEVHQYSVSSKE